VRSVRRVTARIGVIAGGICARLMIVEVADFETTRYVVRGRELMT
jgi:hypothetical protein